MKSLSCRFVPAFWSGPAFRSASASRVVTAFRFVPVFRSVTVSRLVLAGACALVLGACGSMAPSYQRPASPVSAGFRDRMPVGAEPARLTPVPKLAWQQVFLDARLQKVISLALENNRDLRVALLNIDKARAQYRIQRADQFPAVSASGSRSAHRSSAATSMSGRSGVSRSASVSVGISSWELDLFGRVQSLKDEALETWLGTEQTQRSTRLSLIAEVASDWLTVAAWQRRLALARQTLASQQKTLELTRQMHALGAASGVDLASVQGSVDTARGDVASYDSSLAQARNALEVVVGAPLDDALLPDPDASGEAVALAPVPANLSSDVLLDRPDVVAAEHTLRAAHANIGAARAAFFPTISLTATTGRASESLSDLFAAGTRTWSFVPSISVPIFQAGALKSSLDVAEISRNIAVAEYESAIQTAFGEVADALVVRARMAEQLDAQQAYVRTSERNHLLTTERYRNGVSSYLEALVAQRSLYSARQGLITLELQEVSNRVTLYKVLGGGTQD